jgi:hypothetical protein
VSHLLATFAEWHALAKLRLHTTSTLDDLGKVTKVLGKALRDFTKMSGKYKTKESSKETAARRARQLKSGSVPSESGARDINYKLDRPKLHFLGDYLATIPYYGTTDSYSTALVSPHHSFSLSPSHSFHHVLSTTSSPSLSLSIALSLHRSLSPSHTLSPPL